LFYRVFDCLCFCNSKRWIIKKIIIISIECGKKVSPKFFSSFLSIRLEFQSEILPKYSVILCAQRYDHHLVSLLYFNVISIIVMPPSDFSVLKKFRTKKPIPENRIQKCMCNSCLDFITKEIWPLNSSKLNHLDHYVRGTVRGLSQAHPKTKDIA